MKLDAEGKFGVSGKMAGNETNSRCEQCSSGGALPFLRRVDEGQLRLRLGLLAIAFALFARPARDSVSCAPSQPGGSSKCPSQNTFTAIVMKPRVHGAAWWTNGHLL
jgi:hypothetical protein